MADAGNQSVMAPEAAASSPPPAAPPAGQTGASSSQTGVSSGQMGSTSTAVEGPGQQLPGTLPPAAWAGLGLTAGLLLALAGMGIAKVLRRKKDAGVSAGRCVTIEKLHEQGRRKSQQDSFFVSAGEDAPPRELIEQGPGLLAVVGDGMGGLSNGDQVSQAAVTAIANSFGMLQGPPEEVLLTLLTRANMAVNDMLGPDGLYSGGSTLVMALLREGRFHCLSVGDSRICLCRDGALFQLNREHVFREELYLRAVNGESSIAEALSHPQGSGLTSFLGMGQLKYADLPAQSVEIRPGDVFILMSDGVYNALTEEELTGILAGGPGAAEAIRAAIQGKDYSNQDNYTAVILRC